MQPVSDNASAPRQCRSAGSAGVINVFNVLNGDAFGKKSALENGE